VVKSRGPAESGINQPAQTFYLTNLIKFEIKMLGIRKRKNVIRQSSPHVYCMVIKFNIQSMRVARFFNITCRKGGCSKKDWCSG